MSISRRDLYAMGEPFGDCATQHKAGGRIYGGGGSSGGGGGGGNTTQTQVVDLPDWAKGYAKEGLGKAAALTDTNQNPYQQYEGDRQAGFTDLQTKSFQGADTMAPSAAMGTAANMAGTAGLGALSAGANFNPYQTGQFTGDTAQNYMNPYMQNVVDIQKREAQRTADIAGTGRNAQAVKSGAFGGSRQAIMDAEANRNLATQMGDIQAKGVDLYVHTQGLDTSTPSGAMMFQMLSVFSSYERAMIRERIMSGLLRTTKKSGRKPMPDDRVEAIRKSLLDGLGIRATARLHRASPMTVTTIRRCQWRGRRASFLRLAMSGSDAVKPLSASSHILYGLSSLIGLGSFLRRPSKSSMPFSRTSMASSAQSVCAHSSRLSVNSE